MKPTELRIILPECSDDMISEGLRYLTEILCKNFSEDCHGGLGGQYGYGFDYENEIFMMHPYCWCEKDDCKWCDGNAPNFYYKPEPDFIQIWWYKYIGRSMEMEPESIDGNKWIEILSHCIKSITGKELEIK